MAVTRVGLKFYKQFTESYKSELSICMTRMVEMFEECLVRHNLRFGSGMTAAKTDRLIEYAAKETARLKKKLDWTYTYAADRRINEGDRVEFDLVLMGFLSACVKTLKKWSAPPYAKVESSSLEVLVSLLCEP